MFIEYKRFADKKIIKMCMCERELTFKQSNSTKHGLLQWLMVIHLFKKFPVITKPTVHHRVHKIPPLDSILNKHNTIQSLAKYISTFHFNIIPFTLTSHNWYFPLRFSNQYFVWISHSPFPASPFRPSSFNHLKNITRREPITNKYNQAYKSMWIKQYIS
jgi:hypothetical protein